MQLFFVRLEIFILIQLETSWFFYQWILSWIQEKHIFLKFWWKFFGNVQNCYIIHENCWIKQHFLETDHFFWNFCLWKWSLLNFLKIFQYSDILQFTSQNFELFSDIFMSWKIWINFYVNFHVEKFTSMQKLKKKLWFRSFETEKSRKIGRKKLL